MLSQRMLSHGRLSHRRLAHRNLSHRKLSHRGFSYSGTYIRAKDIKYQEAKQHPFCLSHLQIIFSGSGEHCVVNTCYGLEAIYGSGIVFEGSP